MTLDQRQAWEELDKSIDTELTGSWRVMSTKPYKENGKWQSVFQLKETAGEPSALPLKFSTELHLKALSLTERIKALTDREQSASLLGLPGVPAVGAAAWIAQGIQLEIQQYTCKHFIVKCRDRL
jgi:hypothetical protein